MATGNHKPSRSSYDAVIIGGGHNGLTCAAYLAKAGHRVLVLERRHVLGGAAVSEELHPGFTFSVCSYVVSLFRPRIIRELQLERHGLEIIPLPCSFLPLPDGRSLCRWEDPHRTYHEIARFSPRDAEVYPTFGLAMTRLARFAKQVIDSPAPDPTSLHPRELLRLSGLARSLGEFDEDLRYLNLKLMTMSAVDFLDQWFESEFLKAPMSVSGIIGTFLGVRSPGTAYVLLHHYMGEIDGAYRAWVGLRQGRHRQRQPGPRLRRPFVRSRDPHRGIGGLRPTLFERATGVVLENGDEIAAKAVVSGVDPGRTFLRLVGERHLDAEFLRNIRRYRFRGSSGKVNLAVDRLPDFSLPSERRARSRTMLRGDIAIAPEHRLPRARVRRSEVRRRTRKRPYLNVVIPSVVGSECRAAGTARRLLRSCSTRRTTSRSRTGPKTGPESTARRSGIRSSTHWPSTALD